MKLDLIYVIIIAIAALAIGAVIGFIIRKIGAEKKIGSAEEQAKKILEEVRTADPDCMQVNWKYPLERVNYVIENVK
jgi:ribonuclease Y